MNQERLALDCLEIKQPIGVFYSAIISAYDLCNISTADIRTLQYTNGNEIDNYLGIQRKVVQSRIKEIKQYIKTFDACFPTSILLHINDECVTYDSKNKQLIIEPTERIAFSEVAKILDGQHRIEGFKAIYDDLLEDKTILKDFQINVSIFIEMDIAQQAIIFSTVNLAQTKVHKSLVYDLYEYSKVNTFEKICHNISVALDSHSKSPFYKKIKRLGSATPDRKNETLTQATVVAALLKYMSASKIDLIKDRDLLLRGKKPLLAEGTLAKQLIFRNMAINDDEKTIADIMFFYFSAVKEKWPMAWENLENTQGLILNRTNGFNGLMLLLRDILLDFNHRPNYNKEVFLDYFERCSLIDQDFNSSTYVPGSSGSSSLYKTLKEQIFD